MGLQNISRTVLRKPKRTSIKERCSDRATVIVPLVSKKTQHGYRLITVNLIIFSASIIMRRMRRLSCRFHFRAANIKRRYEKHSAVAVNSFYCGSPLPHQPSPVHTLRAPRCRSCRDHSAKQAPCSVRMQRSSNREKPLSRSNVGETR